MHFKWPLADLFQSAMEEHEKMAAGETISTEEHRQQLEAIEKEKKAMVEKLQQEKVRKWIIHESEVC